MKFFADVLPLASRTVFFFANTKTSSVPNGDRMMSPGMKYLGRNELIPSIVDNFIISTFCQISGVGNADKGKGRGRGRGTTMKL